MQKIAGILRRDFLRVAEDVVARFIALPENPEKERSGGFMAVMEISGKKMLFVNEVGLCLPEMATDCFAICQEKAGRLCENRPDHVSSWQSRNTSVQKYGGAVAASIHGEGLPVGRGIIGSISGFVEHGDEAIILVTWMIFRWIVLKEAMEIIKISDNHLFKPLLSDCNSLFDWR